jgi:hypothetical protein
LIMSSGLRRIKSQRVIGSGKTGLARLLSARLRTWLDKTLWLDTLKSIYVDLTA